MTLVIASFFAFLTIVSVAALRFAERYGDPDVRAEIDELRRQMHNQTKQQAHVRTELDAVAKAAFATNEAAFGMRVRQNVMEQELGLLQVARTPKNAREERRRLRAERIRELEASRSRFDRDLLADLRREALHDV